MDRGRDRKDAATGDIFAAAALSERVVISGLLVLIALILLPILSFGFVYDDGWTFTANGFLRKAQDLPLLLTDEAARRHVPDAFRPTLVLFDVLAYQLFGLFAPAHHALSIALHLLVCWLAQRWLALLGAPLSLRAGTLALFGLLAIHAEAIAVISFHEDLLAAALGLGALVAASKGLQARSDGAPGRAGRDPRRRALLLGTAGALLMTLACGAKMSVATLPAVFWLAETLDPWRQASAGRARVAAMTVALLAGVGLAVAHTWITHGSLSPYAGEANLRLYASRTGLLPVLAMSAQIHLGYLQQIVVPWGLSPEYVDAGASWREPATLLASAGLGSLLLYGLWAARRRRRPLVALTILGAAALALPTANIAAMPNMRADRLMYLPSLAICLGLAAATIALGRWLVAPRPDPSDGQGRELQDGPPGDGQAHTQIRGGHSQAQSRAQSRAQSQETIQASAPSLAPLLTFAPLAVLAILQGASLLATARVYQNSGALWSVASRRAPGSARAQALYGEILLAGREPEERDSPSDLRRLASVRAHCRRALAIDPLDEISHLCAARLASAEEEWEDAERSLRRALELSVDRNHRILAALAEVTLDLPRLSEEERRERALGVLTRAIREYPYAVEVWGAAGRILHRIGDPARAQLAFRRAYNLAPERPETSLWAIETALDRGEAELARNLLVRRAKPLRSAAPGLKAALERRLEDHALLFPSPPTNPGRVKDPTTGASSR